MKTPEELMDGFGFMGTDAARMARRRQICEIQMDAREELLHDLRQVREALGCDGSDLAQLLGGIDKLKILKQVWHKFDRAKGFRQKRPPIRRWVVVQLAPADPHKIDLGIELKPDVPGLIASYPSGLAVGYRKDAAGDKTCPYFVIPGIGGEVTAWCDCLPGDFQPSEEWQNWWNQKSDAVS